MMFKRSMSLAVALLGLSMAAGAADAPFDIKDPARVAAGKLRFGSTCAAYCHGNEGTGGKAPSFKGRKDFVAADAFKTITEGRRGADIMPPWGNAYTPEEIWELVAYLQHLSTLPAN
ncbi:MAG TPA: cytochrome c [Methylibium sp.]|nr:cytochrome c [Methylibium sp.]